MWNPFKRKSKSLKTLQSLSATFAILNEFERRGLLHWQRSQPSSAGSNTPDGAHAPSSGSLLIEESLATIQLAQGAEAFRHFLTQCAQWQNFKLLQEAYERHRIDTEAKAVREAQAAYTAAHQADLGATADGVSTPSSAPKLTKADITRIRQNARDKMLELDPTAILGGATQDFDLFIIRATAPSSAHATEANGQLLALGHYDGKTLEMAMYDDIKHNLHPQD